MLVIIWVLLEGSLSPVKLKVDITRVIDLNDLKEFLIREFSKELANVGLQSIVFLDSKNTQLSPGTGIRTLAATITDNNPLIVRYPLSDSISKLHSFLL